MRRGGSADLRNVDFRYAPRAYKGSDSRHIQMRREAALPVCAVYDEDVRSRDAFLKPCAAFGCVGNVTDHSTVGERDAKSEGRKSGRERMPYGERFQAQTVVERNAAARSDRTEAKMFQAGKLFSDRPDGLGMRVAGNRRMRSLSDPPGTKPCDAANGIAVAVGDEDRV